MEDLDSESDCNSSDSGLDTGHSTIDTIHLTNLPDIHQANLPDIHQTNLPDNNNLHNQTNLADTQADST